MTFYLAIGRDGGHTSILALPLDKVSQEELTEMFERLASTILQRDHRPFDPGYRADEREIVTIAPYELPIAWSALGSAGAAGELEPVREADMRNIRGLIGVEWAPHKPGRMLFQRIDHRYVLRRQGRRLLLAEGRFVRDERPGLEIADRIDAVLDDSTLYVASWSRAHGLLDLSAWIREATMAEAARFIQHKTFLASEEFDVAAVADTWVRRKITSISDSGLLERARPPALRKYAAEFKVDLQLVAGKIVLPADKKSFKAVLNLLDQDLLSFEPTGERWIVNSKRHVQ